MWAESMSGPLYARVEGAYIACVNKPNGVCYARANVSLYTDYFMSYINLYYKEKNNKKKYLALRQLRIKLHRTDALLCTYSNLKKINGAKLGRFFNTKFVF